MSIKPITLVIIVLLLVSQCTQKKGFPPGKWLDLSYELSSETLYWPTAEPFKLDTVSAGVTDNGYYYSAFNFCADEHGGTHIDAPIHFAENKNTVDQIPLSQLIGAAVKIDVSKKVQANRNYQIEIDDVIAWESENGQIPEGCIILFYTGISKHWPNALKYLGTEKRGAAGVAELSFPGLRVEAAEWLIKNRKIKAVGIDTASIDYGQSKNFETHVKLLGENIPALENVANLVKVPTKGAHIVALPIKIKGGSGGPVRIIAFLEE